MNHLIYGFMNLDLWILLFFPFSISFRVKFNCYPFNWLKIKAKLSFVSFFGSFGTGWIFEISIIKNVADHFNYNQRWILHHLPPTKRNKKEGTYF